MANFKNKAEMDDIQARYDSENSCFVEITSDDMTCRDCIFKHRNGGICDIYPITNPKPVSIIRGGDCDKKVKE